MPYNFVADSFHTKKLCSKETCFKRSAIFEPLLRGLGATCDDHLRLIGKRIVDFILVVIELFSLGVTAEALRANIDSKSAISLQRRPVDPKFQVEGVVPHQPSFFSENYCKWSFIWYKNLGRCFFRFVTMHAFDGQTDRETDRQNSHR